MIFGCAAPAYRTHQELEMRAKNIKTAGLAPPVTKIYELTAGGVRELKDDWSAHGKQNVTRTIIESFKGKPMEIKMLTIDKDIEEEIEDVRALYEAVSTSILQHTYGETSLFPEKQKNFDY